MFNHINKIPACHARVGSVMSLLTMLKDRVESVISKTSDRGIAAQKYYEIITATDVFTHSLLRVLSHNIKLYGI